MSTQGGVTIDRDLLSALKPEICAEGSDVFCSASSAGWPQLEDDRTRIVYRSEDPEESVPGSEYLCADYQNWLGQMAAQDNADHDLTRAFLQRIDPTGTRIDRYEQDLTKLSQYCTANIEQREAADRRDDVAAPHQTDVVPPRSITPADVSTWLDTARKYVWEISIAVGGLISAVTIAVTGVYKKFIKLLKALANIDEFRKAEPDKKVDEFVVVGDLEDHFAAQKADIRNAFNALGYREKLFLAYTVKEKWLRMGKMFRRAYLAVGFLGGDGLPRSYIADSVGRPKKFGSVKANAKNVEWTNRLVDVIQTEVKPVEDVVNEQLRPLVEGTFTGRPPSDKGLVLKYLTWHAMRTWGRVNHEEKRRSIRETMEKVDEGRLPANFITNYVQTHFSAESIVPPKNTIRLVLLCRQLLEHEGPLRTAPFEEVVASAHRMLGAWGELKRSKTLDLKTVFGGTPRGMVLPPAFVGSQLRPKLEPAEEAPSGRAPAEPVEDTDLSQPARPVVHVDEFDAGPPERAYRSMWHTVAAVLMYPFIKLGEIISPLKLKKLETRRRFRNFFPISIRETSLSPRVIRSSELPSLSPILRMADARGRPRDVVNYLRYRGLLQQLQADWTALDARLKVGFEKGEMDSAFRAEGLDVPFSYLRFWSIANMDLYELEGVFVVSDAGDDDDYDNDGGPGGTNGGTGGGAAGGTPTTAGPSPAPECGGSSSAPASRMSRIGSAVMPGAAVYAGGPFPMLPAAMKPVLWGMPLMPVLATSSGAI